MLYEFNRSGCDSREFAALTKEIGVRVLNCSTTGCLVETDTAVEVGTVAVLRIAVNGRELHDTVQVVRCDEIEAAGVYQVGMQFVVTNPPNAETVRYMVHRSGRRLK